MITIYKLFGLFFYPFFIVIIYLRKFFKKEDNTRFKEKLFPSKFFINRNKTKKLIWFHAASIGETQSIIPLVKKITVSDSNVDIIITTVTITSANLIKEKFYNYKNVKHRYLPLDIVFLIKNFLLGWKPNIVIFVDSEIWPNFLTEINKKKIPLILLNGRITKKTYLRWSLIPNTAKKVFKTFDLCLVSNNESKKYLKNFEAKNIKYIGNLKLATEHSLSSVNEKNKDIFKQKKIWCAVSTHKGEESFIVRTHLRLKKENKNIITMIIPRHIDRADTIGLICKENKLPHQILSNNEPIDLNKEIIIINSYGMVPDYLKLCKSVFIGKSLIKKLQLVGGQNPIEAAKLGCKIYHGPYVYNFNEIYELLNKYKITEEILSENDLSNKINFDLNNSNIKRDENIIRSINNLGEKILDDTFEELKRFNN